MIQKLFEPCFSSNILAAGLLVAGCLSGVRLSADESPQLDNAATSENRITMDVYVRHDSERCRQLNSFLKVLASQRHGLDVVVHDVAQDLDARKQFFELCRTHRVEKAGLPAVHVMNQLRLGYTDSPEGQAGIRSLLAIEVFIRHGCPHCRDAKVFLHDLQKRWPALRFDYREIVSEPAARDRLMVLVNHYGIQACSVPAFHFCRQLKVGFISRETTGKEIESTIRQAAEGISSADASPRNTPSTNKPKATPASTDNGQGLSRRSFSRLLNLPLAVIQLPKANRKFSRSPSPTADPIDELPPEMEFDGNISPPLPQLPDQTSATSNDVEKTAEEPGTAEMQVPVFGRLNVETLGMPVFTFLVGLVDGFNPCAMWVLMFLLSVLVNIQERRKIILIAGTFVVISGLAYFAFMAAWLNVFMLVGLNRPAQIALGSIALVIGSVNVKDFFAFGKGVSLKIPERAKPGIYARVRSIVAAKHIWAALTGAVILAVLVNTIELLCTAGLPAMYTEILTLQKYSSFVNYLYLFLYIAAYMLDDSILVAVVVITLSKSKLQESQGRWLKLLSGLVVLTLGAVMIAKPDWLV